MSEKKHIRFLLIGVLMTGIIAPAVLAAADDTITALELVADIREDLKEIDDQIRNHIYLSDLQKGKVSVEALRAFPGHQYHTVLSDLRSMALFVQRFGNDPTARFFEWSSSRRVCSYREHRCVGSKIRDDGSRSKKI